MIDVYLMLPRAASLAHTSSNSREVVGDRGGWGICKLVMPHSERAVLTHRGTVLDTVSNLDNS